MYTLAMPHPALGRWIQNYWAVAARPGEQVDVKVDVFVDARADLVLNFGAAYTRQLAGKPAVEFFDSNLDAQRRFPIRIRQRGDIAIVGVRFLAGGLAPFLREPAHLLTDRTPAPHEVFGDRIVHTIEECGTGIRTARTEGGMDELKKLLDGFFLENLNPDRSVEDFFHIKTEIENGFSATSIASISQEVARSHRAVDRLFARYMGLSPRWYLKICRFQTAVKMLMKDPGMSLAELAADCGYYDQSHFIKDFRICTGGLPRGYRGYYPSGQPSDFAPNVVQFLQYDPFEQG